jgi:hypothetical protein
VWDLHDTTSDTPSFVGVTPKELADDKQTCVKFNPAAPRELVTNGKRGVAFFCSDKDEEKDEDEDHESVSGALTEDNVQKLEKRRSTRLRAYAPPVRAGDLNQRVADFTSSAFVTVPCDGSSGAEGLGRCVTGTAEGDLVVWMAGGVPPGGPGAFEARGMRETDRRAVKIVRAHARGAVTHASRVAVGETFADADVFLVTGGSDGNVRFFDVELRLVAWFDGLDAGGVTSVSFVKKRHPPKARRLFRKALTPKRPALSATATRRPRRSPRPISSSPRKRRWFTH